MLVEFQHHHVGADRPGGQGDQDPDRAAADHDDLLAGDHAAPADVVHRDRRRLDERRQLQARGPAGSRTSTRVGTVHDDCMEPAESMPRKFSRWQMWL